LVTASTAPAQLARGPCSNHFFALLPPLASYLLSAVTSSPLPVLLLLPLAILLRVACCVLMR
jgi:hypothetical protein